MSILLSALRRVFRRQEPATRKVVWDALGFRVLREDEIVIERDWAAIIEVYAFKVDLFGWDEIRVGFRDVDQWCGLVSEEDLGYKEFLAYLELRFPGIRTDWFFEVAFPAFETNRTTLWGVPPDRLTE